MKKLAKQKNVKSFFMIFYLVILVHFNMSEIKSQAFKKLVFFLQMDILV